MKQHTKWILYLGLNLHTRLRYRQIPEYLWHSSNGSDRVVLDAAIGYELTPPIGINGLIHQAFNNRITRCSGKGEEGSACLPGHALLGSAAFR